MRGLIRKIHGKIRFYKEKSARANPEYTRRDWYMKAAQITIGSLTVGFLGEKLSWYDFEVYYKRMSIDQVLYSTPYVFYLIIQGTFIALTFWRLLEIYWWAKNRCEENDKYFHSL